MPSFVDTKKRTWRVVIDLLIAERLMEDAGVNVFELLDGFPELRNLRRFQMNPRDQAAAIYVCVREQLENANVSIEEFKSSFDADVAEKAREAFEEAAVGFFPNAQLRPLIRDLLSHNKRLTTAMMEEATAKLATIDMDEIEANFRAKIRGIADGSNKPIESEESLESTPAA